MRDRALSAAAVRHEAEYYIPVEHHNPMELFASTVIWEGDGKLTVYDKTQGVQNVQRYLCGVFGMKSERRARQITLSSAARLVRASAAVPGRAGGARCAGVETPRASRADPAADVRALLPAGEPSSASRSAPPPPANWMRSRHEAIAMTSQHEEFARNDTGWSGAALQVR